MSPQGQKSPLRIEIEGLFECNETLGLVHLIDLLPEYEKSKIREVLNSMSKANVIELNEDQQWQKVGADQRSAKGKPPPEPPTHQPMPGEPLFTLCDDEPKNSHQAQDAESDTVSEDTELDKQDDPVAAALENHTAAAFSALNEYARSVGDPEIVEALVNGIHAAVEATDAYKATKNAQA